MKIRVYDAVKIPEDEWDTTPPEERGYIEQYRKNGFVYGVNKIQKSTDDIKEKEKEQDLDLLRAEIEFEWSLYQRDQDRHRKLTGKEHEWLR